MLLVVFRNQSTELDKWGRKRKIICMTSIRHKDHNKLVIINNKLRILLIASDIIDSFYTYIYDVNV